MPELYIGPAGFAYKDWEGIVYPRGLRKRQHPVEYLAQFFDCIEINTSFYGHLKPEMARAWAESAARANSRFQFTAKLNKAFTHSPVAVVEPTAAATIRATAQDEADAKAGLAPLTEAGRLGALLAQFPVSFKNTDENREYLAGLLERFREFPLAVEVRHDSWNNEATLRDFAARGVAFCNIDQPKLGRSLRPTTHVTAPLGYVRLHGRRYDQWFTASERGHERYNYLYPRDELERWGERVQHVAEKAEKTFVVTNNHYKGKAAANALELKQMLTGKKVRVPPLLTKEYPRLAEIAEPDPAAEGQGASLWPA
jgi:uncharacterized protein YecE (DUF72 family)